MLRFTTGDILAEDAEALVNTVNCVVVMGRGVALQFKKAFPENFRAYAKASQRGAMKLGAVFVFTDRYPHQSPHHHQLSHQAPPAWQQPDRGH